MIDPSLIFRIKQFRARGKTYDEIAEALHISFSTISRALKAGATKKKSTTTLPASSFGGGSSYILDNIPIENGGALYDSENNALGDSRDIHINKKGTKLMADREGLRFSIDNPGRSSNSQLIYAPLPSWFWKLFFIFIGIVIFIRILKKMRENALENE